MPLFEPLVRPRYERDDPSLLARDPAHVHAHLTVLSPVPGQLDSGTAGRLARALARVEPFDVEIADIATFPNGIIHATLRDRRSFDALVAAVREVFTDVDPYGGEFCAAPHITIDATSTGATEESVRAEAADLLGRSAPIDRVELVWYRSGEVGVRAAWRLGPASPA